MATRMKKEDLEWQAESDARTMASYHEILQDKARMARAIKVAGKQAKDLTERASIMQRVAKAGTKGKK